MIAPLSKLFLNVLLLLLSPFFLLILLPIYAFRFFVSKVVIHCYPGIDKILTTKSSCTGSEPMYKFPRCNLMTVTVAEGTISLEVFKELFSSRVLEAKNLSGEHAMPEFKQYVTRRLGFLFWKWEKNFDINNHVRVYDGKYADRIRSGAMAVNAGTVLHIGDKECYQPFRPKTSPWEIYLVHNYQEQDPVSGQQVGPICTAMIMKVHHSIGDGFSLAKCFNNNFSQNAKPLDTGAKAVYVRSKGSHISRALDYIFSAPYEFLSLSKSAVDVNSWHIPESQLTYKMNSAISRLIPLEYFKDIKNSNKVSFTALVIDCYTAALRRFMSEAGYDVPEVIHCATALPVPGHPDKMRNHTTGILTTLPVGEPDSKRRLEAIEKNLLDLKGSSFPVTLFHITTAVGGLFSWMIPAITKNESTTAILSNFPGPSTPLYVNEHKVTSMWFGGGLHSGNCGIGFGAMSYGGFLRINAGLDEAIVPRTSLPASLLIQYFLDELDVLKKEAIV